MGTLARFVALTSDKSVQHTLKKHADAFRAGIASPNETVLYGFELLFEFAAVFDHNLLAGAAAVASERFDVLNYIHTLDDSTENHVLTIEPLGLYRCDKELRPVGIATSVAMLSRPGHRERT